MNEIIIDYQRNVQKLQICDAIYITLRESIIQNRLDHSNRLKEEEIATLLNVSRTPVREALHLLQQNEFIVADPEKGYMIKEITLKESIDIIVYTRFLRSCAAEIVAYNIDPMQLKLLEDKKMTQVKIDSLNDIEGCSTTYKCHQEFHLSIAKMTRNNFLINESVKVHRKLLMIHYYYTSNMKSDFPAVIYKQEHEKVIEAFKTHDAKGAREIVYNYSKNMFHVIKRMYALNQN